MIVLAIAVILLCAAGITVTCYRMREYGFTPTFADIMKFPLLIAVCVFCIVLVVAILVKSQYAVDDTYYTTQFGFIKSKFLIKDITAIELNTDTQKLTVFVGENFSVLTLSPDWRDEFIAAIREVNPDVDFSFTLAENTDGKKKKK